MKLLLWYNIHHFSSYLLAADTNYLTIAECSVGKKKQSYNVLKRRMSIFEWLPQRDWWYLTFYECQETKNEFQHDNANCLCLNSFSKSRSFVYSFMWKELILLLIIFLEMIREGILKVSMTHFTHTFTTFILRNEFFFSVTKSSGIIGDVRLLWGDRTILLTWITKGYEVKWFLCCIFSHYLSHPPCLPMIQS
jgi:hypothetical protein